jgi:hypothetical protein
LVYAKSILRANIKPWVIAVMSLLLLGGRETTIPGVNTTKRRTKIIKRTIFIIELYIIQIKYIIFYS